MGDVREAGRGRLGSPFTDWLCYVAFGVVMYYEMSVAFGETAWDSVLRRGPWRDAVMICFALLLGTAIGRRAERRARAYFLKKVGSPDHQRTEESAVPPDMPPQNSR